MEHDATLRSHCHLLVRTAVLCRSTMEHVYGILLEHVHDILLDEKFPYRSVHAAFVNTTWYEAWLERTLFFGPIIFDMWSPVVLSWAPGQLCNCQHTRHTDHDRLAVPCLRHGSFFYHKWVGGRGCGQQPDAFFPLARSAAATWRILGWSQRSSLIVVVSSHRVVCFPQSLAIACFRRVSPLLVFLLGLRCQQKYGALVVFLVLSVCVNEFLFHASFAHRDGRWYGSA